MTTPGETAPRVRYQATDDGVAIVTLNRAEKRNALDPDTVTALRDAFTRAAADAGARVVLLRAEGKDFCAGADIAHLESLLDAPREVILADAQHLGALFVQMRRLPKPIVAAVQGNALAGGAGLATACDVVLAADDAQFGYPEIHIGFVPAIVMTMLVRHLGEKRVFGLVAGGKRVSAQESLEVGLINCVYSRHTFADDSLAYCVEMATRSATALAYAKQLLHDLDDLSFEAGIARGAEVNADARQTEACRAGLRAFLSRQRPGEEPGSPGPIT